MKRVFLLTTLVAAAVLALWPAASGAATFRGVVVAKQHGVLLVATSAGTVHTVRASSSARLGSRVAVSGSSVRVVGRASRAEVRGVLVRKTTHTLYLSAGHRLLAVHSSRALASAADQPNGQLQAGAMVQSTVSFSGDDLEDDDTQVVGTTNSTQITATITGVTAGAITVTVAGSTTPLTIPLPAGLTLPSTLVGQSITLAVDFSGGEAQAQPEDQQGSSGQSGNTQGDNGGGGDG